MNYNSKPERYVFAAAMLITAAIILFNVVDLPNNEKIIISSDVVTVSETQTADSEKSETTVEINFPININSATIDELQEIDGIGYNLAYQIVSYRNEIGSYTDISQLLNIRGISENVLNKIAPYICL